MARTGWNCTAGSIPSALRLPTDCCYLPPFDRSAPGCDNASVRVLITLAMLLLAPAAAHAQTTELQSARALGMGGAFRGMVWDNSAVDLNPAGMPQLSRFSFEGGYYRTPDDGEYALNVSLVDSLTNRVATGFAVEYKKREAGRNGDPGLDQTRWIAAVGLPIVPQKIFLGVNSKIALVKYPRAVPAKGDKRIITGDVGVLWRPFQIAAIGATFDNLVNGGHEEAPRSVTLGASALPAQWLALSGDVFVDLASQDRDQTGWALGIQVTPHRNIALRGGAYEHPLTHRRTWTAGIGLQGEGGALDYSVRLPTKDEHDADPAFDEILTHYVTVSLLVF